MRGTKQSHIIDNQHVEIASPFVPQGRNDEKPLFGADSEFKSKLSKNRILIPKKIQSELQDTVEKNVRVIIFWEEETDSIDLKSYPTDVMSIDIVLFGRR